MRPESNLLLRRFHGTCHTEGGSLMQMRGQDLHAHRQPGAGESAWYSHAADAGQAGRDGLNVCEVHGQRVARLFAQLECRRGRSGRDDGVYIGEGSQKLFSKEAAHLLRLAVVRVVIAC